MKLHIYQHLPPVHFSEEQRRIFLYFSLTALLRLAKLNSLTLHPADLRHRSTKSTFSPGLKRLCGPRLPKFLVDYADQIVDVVALDQVHGGGGFRCTYKFHKVFVNSLRLCRNVFI